MTKMLTAVVDLYYSYLWLCGVCYALCLLRSPCSVVLLSDVFCSTLTKFPAALLVLRHSPYWSSACPRIWGFAPWDSLSGYVHHGIACLASQASDWAGALWDSLDGQLNY